MILYLSKHLGHASPNETYYYYHLIKDSLKIMSTKDVTGKKLWKVLNMKKNSELFFSKTKNFLTVYLVKQCNKSVHTVKSYKDTLTIFRRFIGEVENISIKTFKFSDCKRDVLLKFIEYLRNGRAAVSTINNKLAGIRAYLWYCSDEDVELQPIAIMASRIPLLKEPKLIRPIISPEIMTDFL